MSREDSPEFLDTWVFVNLKPDEVIQQTKDISGVQEVAENDLHDSDTDSISVISSYKTDEEELTLTEVSAEKHEEKRNDVVELIDKEPEIVSTQTEVTTESVATRPDENAAIEKLMYFATSAVCAIILVGFSIAVQKYVHNASNIDNYEPDQFFPHVQNLKGEKILKEHEPTRFHIKRKNQLKLEEFEHKVAKLQSDNEFHDKIASSVGDNDLKVEGNFKSNYKLNKNKNTAAKCNKENCDLPKKPIRFSTTTTIEPEESNPKMTSDEAHGEACDKKIKQLRIKEDYLREKEKFLIEKEHNLLKQEIKLNKEKQQHTKNRHNKNTFDRKGKKYSEEFDSSEKKDKVNHKKHTNERNHKKKSKEDKKKEPQQKRFWFSDEQGKERNMSGQWYMNLHEARDNMRQKKRSHFKKNKAHWYFQWMVDRARLRVK